jgi:phosphoribosylformylglycinamidine cyclo-ligase
VQLDLSKVVALPVFRWLAQTGGVATPEMLRTFNCGIGMVAIAAPDKADALLAAFRAHGETATQIGTVVPAAGEARVTYRGALDLSL